ncbi:hypothetical protein A9Q84_02445 [Halobacteriovorax marinus]|uniref:Uncharacterized protein n=1 Tax=Halobacteriovorax marinus TaxID=97084 RepID=A0A1Y5FCU7_9BACT|nr:hypothetical protein A9Q84_02445 [Halobacteriovorax marinus]
MLKIISTIVIMLLLTIPFLSTPLGEELFYDYQETKLHKAIYCQYVEWFGAQGFSQVKFYLKCKL